MTLCFSHLLLLLPPSSSLIYFSLFFLFMLKLIMPYCYHHSQSMLNKYYFCKKSVHSFLGNLSNTTTMGTSPPPPVVSECGLGLIIANEFNPNNVVKSSSLVPHLDSNVVKSSSLLPHLDTKPAPKKKVDPGGIGFIDDMGGGFDGLASCTESLGSESCSERRRVDDDDDDGCKYVDFCEEESRDNKWRSIRKRIEEKKSSELDKKKFPPPLSSLNQNGQPRFYLRPVRQNGRLELTEVKLDRPEVLRAVRENGRLKLHLVTTDSCSKLNQQEEEEEEEIEQQVHDLQQQEQEEEEEEMKVGELWNYRVNGEGSRRCHEMVNYHQQHHDHHVWRQPCVPIR